MKHLDFCTHIQFPEDHDVLKRKLFDVNIRLFHSSTQYKRIVLEVCDYIVWLARTEKEGYKKPHGWSGANAGIPWNIIAYTHNDEVFVMINPRITNAFGDFKSVKTNCGSLTLEEPRKVHRSEFIDVNYEDTNGLTQIKRFGPTPGYTVQHEIQHNLGILITDLT